MERLPGNIFLKYNSDTLINVRKIYNLDKPGQMDEVVDLFDAWVKKQGHFVKKDFPREYLERMIIQSKGSVERAKAQLESICTLRTLLPHFFEKCDARNDYSILEGLTCKATLPKLTKENIRIILSRYHLKNIKNLSHVSKSMLLEYFHYILVCEYLKSNDYSAGIILVIDARDVNFLEVMPHFNLFEMKQICTIFLEGYAVRIKNLLFITPSKTIDFVLKILKPMLSEKVGKRIQVLKDGEELNEYVPKELLPSDYGGLEPSLAELKDALTEEMSSEHNVKYFREMSKCQTIESLRTSSSKHHENFSDIAGTFRTLCVD